MGRVDDIILKCKAEVGGIDQYLKSLAILLVEFIYWNEEYSNNRKDPKPIQDGETDIDLISLGIRNIDIDNEYIAATNRESDENCFASDISSPPKGVILSGESGCGKSKLAETLAVKSGINYQYVNCTDLFRSGIGESERLLMSIFETPKFSTKILIMENLEIICSSGEVEERLYGLLIELIDKYNNVFIIATTGRPEQISKQIMRAGRLDSTISITLGSPLRRAEIMKVMLQGYPVNKNDIEEISRYIGANSHGFSAADLKNLCLEAYYIYIKRSHKGGSEENLKNEMAQKDFDEALNTVQPSLLRDYQIKIPKFRFSDIYGLDNIKSLLHERVVIPIINLENISAAKNNEISSRPPKGVLIHGPSGVGKSMLGYAIANETGINVIFADASEIRSMVVGESEKSIQRLFKHARASSPSIIIFDHVDTLAINRQGEDSTSEGSSLRILTTLLTEIDGFDSDNSNSDSDFVMIIAVCNNVESIDPAFLRPGRLDIHIQLELPDQKERLKILCGILDKIPNNFTMEYYHELCDLTSGWTGAELYNLCKTAALLSLRSNIDSKTVDRRNLEEALEKCNKYRNVILQKPH